MATCMIFFESKNCNLNSAVDSLSSYNFNVNREGETLLAKKGNNQIFKIILVTDKYVQEEAIEISEGSEHAEKMKLCDSRFELVIADLDEALDEINTLIEAQGALQDASQGYLFTPWNGLISKPWLE